VGCHVDVTLDARRWPGHARNVVARRVAAEPRVLVTAHLDTKPGTPGALDNAAGVVVLLQLARLLHARASVELVAFNGEDYFNAAGEVDYLRRSESAGRSLADFDLVVNIDAAGSAGDDVAWSAYNIEGPDLHRVRRDLRRSGIVPGPQWWQSDHAIFAMRGCPAVAFTSAHLTEVLATVVHTEADVPEKVDAASLEMLARAIADLLRAWPGVCDSLAS
jgi:aminopeptidase YwaD